MVPAQVLHDAVEARAVSRQTLTAALLAAATQALPPGASLAPSSSVPPLLALLLDDALFPRGQDSSSPTAAAISSQALNAALVLLSEADMSPPAPADATGGGDGAWAVLDALSGAPHANRRFAPSVDAATCVVRHSWRVADGAPAGRHPTRTGAEEPSAGAGAAAGQAVAPALSRWIQAAPPHALWAVLGAAVRLAQAESSPPTAAGARPAAHHLAMALLAFDRLQRAWAATAAPPPPGARAAEPWDGGAAQQRRRRWPRGHVPEGRQRQAGGRSPAAGSGPSGEEVADEQWRANACADLLTLLAAREPSAGAASGPTQPLRQGRLPLTPIGRAPGPPRARGPAGGGGNEASALLLTSVYEQGLAVCGLALAEALPAATLLRVCEAYLQGLGQLEQATSVALSAPPASSAALVAFLLGCPQLRGTSAGNGGGGGGGGGALQRRGGGKRHDAALRQAVLVALVQQACQLRSTPLLEAALSVVQEQQRPPGRPHPHPHGAGGGGGLGALVRSGSFRRQAFASTLLLLLREPPTATALSLLEAWLAFDREQSAPLPLGPGVAPHAAHSTTHLAPAVWATIGAAALRHLEAAGGAGAERQEVAARVALACAPQCSPRQAAWLRLSVAAAAVELGLDGKVVCAALAPVVRSGAVLRAAQPEPAAAAGGLGASRARHTVLDAAIMFVNRAAAAVRGGQVAGDAQRLAVQAVVQAVEALGRQPPAAQLHLSEGAHRSVMTLLCAHGEYAAALKVSHPSPPTRGRRSTDGRTQQHHAMRSNWCVVPLALLLLLQAWEMWGALRSSLRVSRMLLEQLLVAAAEEQQWGAASELSALVLGQDWRWPSSAEELEQRPGVLQQRWASQGAAARRAHLAVLSTTRPDLARALSRQEEGIRDAEHAMNA